MPEQVSSSALAEFSLRGKDRMGDTALGKEAERILVN